METSRHKEGQRLQFHGNRYHGDMRNSMQRNMIVRRLDCTMLFVDRGLSIDIIFDFSL